MSSKDKILKKEGRQPSELELTIAQLFQDIEHAKSSISQRVAPLKICGARQYLVKGGKKAVVIFVPFPQLLAYHRIQVQLTSALEKKLENTHIVIVAKRRIIPPPKRGTKYSQPRPRSRTITDVQEKILDDVVYPAEIIGKRTRFRTDGSSFMKIHLEKRIKSDMEEKVETMKAVYNRLTGKKIVFEWH